jgi:hypothetical protein
VPAPTLPLDAACSVAVALADLPDEERLARLDSATSPDALER